MIIIYRKDNSEVLVHHPIDARELIKTGKYFTEPQVNKDVVPKPEIVKEKILELKIVKENSPVESKEVSEKSKSEDPVKRSEQKESIEKAKLNKAIKYNTTSSVDKDKSKKKK